MIIDVCLFNDENELFNERFRSLCDVIDKFVVVEYSKTFSGKTKNQKFDFSKFTHTELKKISYHFLQSPEPIQMSDAQRTGFTHPRETFYWKHSEQQPGSLELGVRREIAQRDNIINILCEFATDDDIIIVSDVDEIPNKKQIMSYKDKLGNFPYYFEMDWRIFYSNFKCDEKWYGSYITNLQVIKKYSVDLLRVGSSVFPFREELKISDGGMHLSYLGGIPAIRKKLKSLPYQGLRAELTKHLIQFFPIILKVMMNQGKDILFQGRHFELLSHKNNSNKYVTDDFMLKYSKV